MEVINCHLCDAKIRPIPGRGFEGAAGVQFMLHLHNVHGLDANQCTAEMHDRLFSEESTSHTHTANQAPTIGNPTTASA